MTQIKSQTARGGAKHNSQKNSVVLVCEHASHHIPAQFDNLGLSREDRTSHAAWDPGALAVAEALAADLNASLVAAPVSRLVYDCNRPPEAPDAMPERSEIIEVPGNRNLSQTAKTARIDAYYLPFYAALRSAIEAVCKPIIVTVHSFTPVFHGKPRVTEIGVLHDMDARLADAMLDTARAHTNLSVERNQPYGPQDGVTHTLKEHALEAGHLNVMLELRNDLIETPQQQARIAAMLGAWIRAALAAVQTEESATCQA